MADLRRFEIFLVKKAHFPTFISYLIAIKSFNKYINKARKVGIWPEVGIHSTSRRKCQDFLPKVLPFSFDILTVDNSPELAAILSLKADMDQSYADFAEAHKNQVIEFNGCITYLTNHDNYDTRYDLLISAGDYVDENTANPGPTFKFKDVGVYDLGDGLTLADYIKVGSNVRIQAKVRSYNSDTGLFELDPVSVEAR